MDDAQKIASIARDSKISAVFIDVGRQSNPKLLDLAHKMDAEYINLPRANAKDLSQSLKPRWKKRDRNYTKMVAVNNEFRIYKVRKIQLAHSEI